MSSCVWAGDAPQRRGVAVGILCAAALAGGLVLYARPISVALVADAAPAVDLDRQITATFGMERPLVWILESRDGPIWTTEGLTRVQELTRAVFRIPGVISPDVVSLASPNLRDLRFGDGGLEPVYLMGRVPESAEEMARLRARVEGDPMFRGSLTSLDGTAAMIVANFRADEPDETIARAALELRARYDDGSTRAYVVGAPVAASMTANARGPLTVAAVVAVVFPLALLSWWLGPRATGAALLTGASAAGLTLIGAWRGDSLVLPWMAFPTLLAALVAGRALRAEPSRFGALAAGCVGGMVGFAVFAIFSEPPVRAFATTGVFACAAALLCGWLGGIAIHPGPRPPPFRLAVRHRRALVAALLVAAAAGAVRLRPDFALAGYGTRYLPESATRDLDALDRLFPPPTFLVLRVRGAPGFVASPAVLGAFDHLREGLRGDAAVRQVTSLADLVKMVHRSFNDGRAEFFSIPEDRAMVARYLALAYSPGFRRFVDRAQARAAIWIALDSRAPADVGRVARSVDRLLDERPIPDASVDAFGGDGARILTMAHGARTIAVGCGFVLLSIAVGIGLVAGAGAMLRAIGVALGSATVVAGIVGWLGHRIDLVTLPAILAVALVGALWSPLAAASAPRAKVRSTDTEATG